MPAEFIWTSSHPDCRIPLTARVPSGCQSVVIIRTTFLGDIMTYQVETVLMLHETHVTATPKLQRRISPSSRTNPLFPFHDPQGLFTTPKAKAIPQYRKKLDKGAQISPMIKKKKKAHIPPFRSTLTLAKDVTGELWLVRREIPEHRGQTLRGLQWPCLCVIPTPHPCFQCRPDVWLALNQENMAKLQGVTPKTLSVRDSPGWLGAVNIHVASMWQRAMGGLQEATTTTCSPRKYILSVTWRSRGFPSQDSGWECSPGHYLDCSFARPWTEDWAKLCPDSWPTATVRWETCAVSSGYICENLLCRNRTVIGWEKTWGSQVLLCPLWKVTEVILSLATECFADLLPLQIITGRHTEIVLDRAGWACVNPSKGCPLAS